MPRCYFFLCILLFACFLPVKAQTVPGEMDRLHELFKEFRYQEVIYQAEETLQKNQDLSLEENCEILRLLALSYYSRQDMQGALKNFSEILNLDPHYHLNPLENSPKILAFFEEIRRQKQIAESFAPPRQNDTLTTAHARLLADSVRQTSYKQMALSFLLPGSGQIVGGEKTKGWLLLAGNFTLLGTAVYFGAETKRLEDRYLQVTDINKMAGAWEDYNKAYKNRNLFITAFAVLWLYTQIDFIFHPSSSTYTATISCYPAIDRSGHTVFAIDVPL